MDSFESTAEFGLLFASWESGLRSNADPLPIIRRLAELVEKETEAYLKKDPDPFDDRHPGRADPTCSLGHLLKAIFKNDDFMNKLIKNYISQRDHSELNEAACRLLLDLMPGLEISVVFQESEEIVSKLFVWAENANEPLRSYATGLIAAAMEIQEIAGNYREQNSHLVPLMLKRLWDYRLDSNSPVYNGFLQHAMDDCEQCELRNVKIAHKVNGCCENSGNSWAEMELLVIGTYEMHPLSDNMKQRLILQYLTSMGEYQEFIVHIFEYNILNLILQLINLKLNYDARLAFEALKYLATLLCHKKFAIEFLGVNGLEILLAIHRPSIAATGVSMCLYYLAHNEDAMERVCVLNDHILSQLVSFGLWLLECAHDSGRCQATMFFGLAFHYQRILDLFDAQGGLRTLINLIGTIDIQSMNEYVLTDDKIFADRQTIRNVCLTLKRYFESHLSKKVQEICHNQTKLTLEVIQENLDMVSLIPCGQSWQPVDKLHDMCGITLLLQLIHMTFDSIYSGRAETARNALDVLTICSITSRTQLSLCKSRKLNGDVNCTGIQILLEAAEGKTVLDAEVQRSALNVIINCVGGPVTRFYATAKRSLGIAKKKISVRNGEDLLIRVRNCVQANNGIQILLSLLMVKTPITDADSIRALACKALMGLSQCERVKQIISKLPLFTNGLLQTLMKEPVLQDKRAEHVKFFKHALELIEKVTGKQVATGFESSIYKINKADVVAQTKIIYHETDLLKLIYKHLYTKGFAESAATLRREANLKMQPRTRHLTPSTPRIKNAENRLIHHKTPHRSPSCSRQFFLEKSQTSEYKQCPLARRDDVAESTMTLDKIVTEYLRKQHSQCHNPVVTCPKFGLLVPHSCPEPKFRTTASPNFTARVQQRSV